MTERDNYVELEKIVGSRYTPFNKNCKSEYKLVYNILERISNLNSSEKEYIMNRFFNAYYALDSLAIRNKIFFQFLRVTVLISGILIVSLVTLPDFEYILIFLSILSSISFGILQLFKNDLMWVHHRLKFEEVRKELYLFLYLQGKYKEGSTHKEVFGKFVENSEAIFDLEIKDYFSRLQVGFLSLDSKSIR